MVRLTSCHLSRSDSLKLKNRYFFYNSRTCTRWYDTPLSALKPLPTTGLFTSLIRIFGEVRLPSVAEAGC